MGEGEPDRGASPRSSATCSSPASTSRGSLNVDPELELRAAAERFRARVEEAERLAAAAGESWTELDLVAQDKYFDLAKESQ